MPTLKLITIPVSHYCEKARWALDRTGVSYVEKRYLPVAHLLPVWLTGTGHMVPVLLDGKRAVPDSTAILKHADALLPPERQLFPQDPSVRGEVEAWEETFDRQLGPATRRWAYFHVLPERKMVIGVLRGAVGWLARLALPVMFPVVRRLIRIGYRIDPQSAAKSLQRIQTIFEQVNDRLRDGRAYLAGGRFTAADLTFAALSVPVLFPEESGAAMPRLGELPAEMAGIVDGLRRSPAGEFGLRMYRQHRRA